MAADKKNRTVRPCPRCGGVVWRYLRHLEYGGCHGVACGDPRCRFVGPLRKDDDTGVRAWNMLSNAMHKSPGYHPMPAGLEDE